VITETIDAGGTDKDGKKRASGPNPMNGPIFVTGAQPGDALKVDIVRMTPVSATGWTRSSLAANVVDPESVRALPSREPATWLIDRQGLTTRLENPPAGVKPNMLANVELVGEQAADALNIPRSALIRGGAQDRVVVALGDGRFASRKVVAGPESGDRVTIVEGLREGELVVTSAQFLLDSEANLDAGLERLDAEPGEAATAPAAPDPHAAHGGA
jgi:predicted RNA-binding protein with TRAM domain